jgi:parallel beta-helix repeat protein/predicted outer membrane repeat protein
MFIKNSIHSKTLVLFICALLANLAPARIIYVDDDATGAPKATGITLVAENADKRVFVPSGPIVETWRSDPDFDDSTWLTCSGSPGGVGYERASGYGTLISLNVRDQMYNENASCYIRIPFTVDANGLRDPNAMTLKIRYDDSFIAYLNGIEVARRNFTSTPTWNSHASVANPDSSAVVFDHIDIFDHVSVLQQGSNLLAIHGLNVSSTSNDFIISVELVAWVEEQVYFADPYLETAGANDGSSWDYAFIYLQDALAVASSGDEIRVAQGIYKPDHGVGITPDDRNAAFQLKNGIAIVGGYAGCAERYPDERDIDKYETTLSGDLNGDDVEVGDPCDLLDEPTRAENSYHVLFSSYTDETVVLDGITITAGNAVGNFDDKGDPRLDGGGLYIKNSNLTLSDCRFISNSASDNGGGIYCRGGAPGITGNIISGNSARDGGGIWCRDSWGTITGNSITGNMAEDEGGGIFCRQASWPIIADNTIRENTASDNGGGIVCRDGASPTITGNAIIKNAARKNGGGIYCKDSWPIIARNTIKANTAEDGAGMWSKDSTPEITNNMIIANIARYHGGGICCRSNAFPTISNNTMVGNVAWSGGAVRCEENSSQVITNCILWDNATDDLYGCIATYSCIQESQEGTGNISVYPHFVDPISGDYHLRTYSPCIDAGNDSVVLLGQLDFDGEGRILYGCVDMGADEAVSRSHDDDEDGLPDDWERIYFKDTSITQMTPDDDADGDGVTNLQEYHTGTYPVPIETVYVSITNGGDPAADGSRDHPLNSIALGIDASLADVLVAEGLYKEQIVIDSKTLNIRGGYAPDFSEWNPAKYQTRIDARSKGTCVEYNRAPGGTLEGFIITGGTNYSGGGIFCRNSSPTIVRNRITDNEAHDGGGLYCTGRVAPTIISNFIVDNVAEDDGGAIFCDYNCPPLIINNTIVGNKSGPNGGGIHCQEGASPIITNCILWDNIDELYKCVASYSCIQDAEDAGTGNISLYPHFVDPTNGDYHLCSYSPCIDEGDDSVVTENDGDIDGDDRIQMLRVDIGADEATERSSDSDSDSLPDEWERAYFGGTWPDPQSDPDGDGWTTLQEYQAGTDPLSAALTKSIVHVDAANSGDPSADGSREHPFASIQHGIDASSEQVLVATGTYHEQITIDSKELYIVGGYDRDFDRSDPILNRTILDAYRSGRPVTYLNVRGGSLRGFTITGGAERDGGGIYCAGSSPLITNNTIVGNWAQDDGGGIYCKNDPAPTVTGNTIRGNRGGDNGGGIFCRNAAPTVVNNMITGNVADDGAGISCRDSSPLIANNTIIHNTAGDLGGGIRCRGRLDGKNPTITNCIIWGNIAGTDGAQIALGTFAEPSTPRISFCLVEGSQAAIYTETDCTPIWDADNMDVAPLLTVDGHLRSGSPCTDAGALSNIPQLDLDGEARPHGRGVDIGSDEFLDTDGDGLPNWWEQRYFRDPNAADPNDDSDGDGLINLDEYELYSSNPVAAPIYVSPSEGPFRTIQEGINAAEDGDTVLVTRGTYQGAGNKELDFGGKLIILHAPDGPAATVIGFMDSGRGFYFHSGETPAAAVIGFTITGPLGFGEAIRCERSSPQIRNCVITGNRDPTYGASAVYCRLSTPTFADCTISYNSPNGVWIDSGGARIVGTVHIASNDWVGNNCVLYGDGTLHIESDAILALDDSRIRCNIYGTGVLYVDLDSELTVEGDAIVDLGHETDRSKNGTIQCDGLLRVKNNVWILNANINVSRARFEGDASIFNSVITAEAGVPYGQFFIEGTTTITGNRIDADGDRYMDLDPSEFNGVVEDNQICVRITEGVGQTRGGLLELRGQEVVRYPCTDEFACRLEPGTIPDFDVNTWTLEELVLEPDAKVNLTNRFDFHPPYDANGDDEVMYVRNLVLGEGAVLNTAFNRVYYENLYLGPNAAIKNEPLLGFSLVNIALDDQQEFVLRVKHNNVEYRAEQRRQYNRIHVERVKQPPDPNGMMKMCNLLDEDPNSPTYGEVIDARAQGLFAKASEGEILVLFEYLFEPSDPNVALVIYLTDQPELLDPNDPARLEHYVEVARVQPPPPGRPGSPGSGRFGVFHGYVQRGELDFIKGTRIELELVGPAGTCVLINNWDPQVHCSELYCGDVTGEQGANVIDFLMVITSVGSPVEISSDETKPSTTCLEFGFGVDGRVDTLDVSAWDWRLNQLDPLNLCEVPLTAGMATVSAATGSLEGSDTTRLFSLGRPDIRLDTLLVTGKRGTSEVSAKLLEDNLYVLDAQGQYIHKFEPESNRSNGKLVQDSDGEIYQVNHEEGLLQLPDGDCVVPPGQTPYANEPRYNKSATVYIGIQDEDSDPFGRPILDAAFDADYAYVVPVVVNPNEVDPNENKAYVAAAKLQLLSTENPPYRVVRLYDDPPPPGDNQYLDNLREIEIDRAANLYVISTDNLNEADILWVYDTETRQVKRRLTLGNSDGDCYVPAPVTMHVSNTKDRLYLASSKNDPDANSDALYVLSKQDLNIVRTVKINGMGHITDITEDPITGTLWVVGFTMSEIPDYIDSDDEPFVGPFYEPYLAGIPYGSNGPIEAICLSDPISYPDNDLALPLSIIWTATEEKRVNFVDFAVFAAHWLESSCTSPDWCDGADSTGDGNVIFNDLLMFCDNWLLENP